MWCQKQGRRQVPKSGVEQDRKDVVIAMGWSMGEEKCKQ